MKLRNVTYVLGLEDKKVHYVNAQIPLHRVVDGSSGPRVLYAKQADVDKVWEFIVKSLSAKFIGDGLILKNATIISILTARQNKIEVVPIAE